MKRTYILLTLLLCYYLNLFAQVTQLDALTLRLQKTNDFRQKMIILDTLADKTRETDAAESLRYSREQLALAEKLGDTEGVHKAYYNLAYSIDSEGKADSSLYFSQKAYNYFLKQKNHTYVVKSAYISAYELSNMGRQNEAVPIALANAAYADSLKDMSLVGLTSAALGSLYNLIERPNDALPWHEKARKVFESLNDKAKIAGVYYGQAVTYRLLNKDSLAIISMDNALKIYQAINLPIRAVYALNILGELHAEKSQHERAVAYYERAIDLCKKTHLDNILFVIYSHCAYSYVELKNYTKAEKLLKVCIPTVESMQTFEQVKFYETLSDLYSKQGNHKEAMTYMIAARRLEMKKNEEINNQTDALIKKHAVEKQEQENSLLQARSRLYIGGGIALLLLLLFVAWAYSRLRKQKYIIEQQNKELTALNATKDRLFAILSHDLMSPIGTLKNYLSLMDWGVMNQEQFAQSSERLKIKVNNLYGLLENVLHWSITQMQGIKPKVETVNINEVVNEQIALLSTIAKTKGITLTQAIENDVTIQVDRNHLGLIIRNLLQNALKFTPKGGKIHFESHPEYSGKGGTKLTVQDTGIGIPNETLDKLFKVEQNANREGTAQEGGTGLGLILTKELVELNGGTIAVSSKEHRGTVFSLTF